MDHRRTAWLGVVAAALAGCQGGSAPVAGAASASDASATVDTEGIPNRKFRFTYEANIPAPPAGTRQLRVWLPLPRSEPGVQEVADLVIEPASARRTRSADYGNEWAFVELDAPTAALTIRWSAVIARFEDRGQGRGAPGALDLAEHQLVRIQSGAASVEAADRIRTGLGLDSPGITDDAKARKIYEDVLAGMKYDKSGEGWGRGDFLHAVTVCEGNCTDFHARFMGVGRRAGLPVRFTMGIPMNADPSGTYDSYHCWAHWFDAASGTWQPVDISEADKRVEQDPGKAEWFYGHLDPHRVSLTHGRDVMLEPAQAGAPLNYAVFPYAEADGQPVKLDKSMWSFTWADVR